MGTMPKPEPPAFSTNDTHWKEQFCEALGEHTPDAAFGAIGGRAIDDLASVVDDGGTEKQKDFELALSLAENHPELYEIGPEYDFADFQEAIGTSLALVEPGLSY